MSVQAVGRKSMLYYEPSLGKYGEVKHFLTIARAAGEKEGKNGRTVPFFRDQDTGRFIDSTSVVLAPEELQSLLELLRRHANEDKEGVIEMLSKMKEHFNPDFGKDMEVIIYRDDGSININILDSGILIFSVRRKKGDETDIYAFGFRPGIPTLAIYEEIKATYQASINFVVANRLSWLAERRRQERSENNNNNKSKSSNGSSSKKSSSDILDDIENYF